MMPNMDPKAMARMMKQMGVQSEDIDAARVIVEKKDGSKIVVSSPSVVKITVQGQASLQVSGSMSEQAGISAEDVKMVMESAQVDERAARQALQSAKGDIAEAIMKLQEGKQ